MEKVEVALMHRDYKAIQFYRSRISCHYTRAKAVDGSLYNNITYRNKALLKNTRDGNDRYVF